jgi:protein-disulfide isomerase
VKNNYVIIAIAGIVGVIATVLVGNSLISVPENTTPQHFGSVDTTMGSPVFGSISAPITIIEFGDYQCPQCNNWFHNTRPQLETNFIEIGKANLVFVDLAFFGPNSISAAEATYCADDQGKYWEYHNTLYSNQQGINDGWANNENLKSFASQLNLDRKLFDGCLDSEKYKNRVEMNVLEAKRNGASATPTFIIVGPNGVQKTIEGAQPFSVFKQVLDSIT